MEQPGVQQLFFQHIRNNLPPHLSLVDEIAELLNISTDSAYRRIRGEKPISFDEIRALCTHYKVSLDQLFQINSEAIIFSGKNADASTFSFDLYLQNILRQLLFMNSFDRRELICINKDLPVFYYFYYPELASFKFFFWMKTILQYPLFGKTMFVMDDFTQSLLKMGHSIISEYNKLPSQELWNVENVHVTIRQIEYYKETRMFASAAEIVHLYDCLLNTINHIELQAENGFKFMPGTRPDLSSTAYKMYVNEFMIGDNTYLAILNDTKVVYLNHTVLNVIQTRDTAFTEYTYAHFQNLVRKSTPVSVAGEKERSKFFNHMREKIENRKKAVNHYP